MSSAGPSRDTSAAFAGKRHHDDDDPSSRRRSMTPAERQKQQLDRLLKDPSKMVHIPAGPVEKTLRPPREMMKNVTGSSAGAGSGEFHIYKQNRRREYERLKLMEEKSKEEEEAEAFAARQRERQAAADAKTAKNRAKRLKKRGKGSNGATMSSDAGPGGSAAPELFTADGKRRKLAAGGGASAVTFKRPGEEDESSDDDDVDNEGPTDPAALTPNGDTNGALKQAAEDAPKVVEEQNVVIHDSD